MANDEHALSTTTFCRRPSQRPKRICSLCFTPFSCICSFFQHWHRNPELTTGTTRSRFWSVMAIFPPGWAWMPATLSPTLRSLGLTIENPVLSPLSYWSQVSQWVYISLTISIHSGVSNARRGLWIILFPITHWPTVGSSPATIRTVLWATLCSFGLYSLIPVPKVAGIPSASAESVQWGIQEVGDGKNAYVVRSYFRSRYIRLTWLNNLCVQIGNNDFSLVWTVQPPIDDQASVSSLHHSAPAHNS